MAFYICERLDSILNFMCKMCVMDIFAAVYIHKIIILVDIMKIKYWQIKVSVR